MSKKSTQQHHLDGLLVLLLFGVFASCILLVLLTGADTYRRLTARDAHAYNSRTAAQYLTTKVRQSGDAVRIEPFGEAEALTLYETIDGEKYITRIYHHDGYIMELFSSADAVLDPKDGEKILPADGLDFSCDASLLQVSIDGEDEQEMTLTLALRSEEVAP